MRGIGVDSNNWAWLDNSTNDYSSWRSGYPISTVSGFGCAYTKTQSHSWLTVDNFWLNDKTCSSNVMPFICKRPRPAVTTTAATPTKACKTGWIKYGYNCYWLANTTGNSVNARRTCQKNGGQLVSLHSDFENSRVFVLRQCMRIWIGLEYISLRKIGKASGEWAWDDFSPADYFNWAESEPSNSEGCVVMGDGGKWYSTDCATGGIAFVCQQKVAAL